MSARTHFRLWEYRKLDDDLLQLALNFPIGDKKDENIDTITKTSDNQAMTDSDKEVIVNITFQLCKNCDKVFDNQQQLQMHEKECTPESTCPECGKRYSTVQNMRKHFKLKHGDHVKMEQCSSATSSQDDLQINRLSRSKSTESLRTKRSSSSHVVKGLKNNQRKSTGEILLPEGKNSSRTKNKISSQQHTELDKVENMNNVDIEQKIKSNAKISRGKCKSSSDTKSACKTAQKEVTSHNGSSDNPKRQQEKEIQSLKDKQRGSTDKKGNDKRSNHITSSTKMKIIREIKKRNVDDTDQNTSLKNKPISLNGNKHKGTTLTETQESLSCKTTYNKSKIGHGNSKQRLAREQMQPTRQKFSCGLCTKSFTSRMGYNQHCKKMHKNIPDLVKIKTPTTISDLDVSVQTIPRPSSEESSKKWTCTLCPSNFVSCTKLTRHCLDSHNGMQCVNNSIQNREMGELELKQEEECSVNNSKLNNSRNKLGFEENLVFEQGRKEYLKKPHACSLCNRRFNYKRGLSNHCKKEHNGLGIEKYKQLACSVCNAKFKYGKSMKKHCITFHEGSGLKKVDTLIEKTSMFRQNKSGKIKKVKTGTSLNRRVTLHKAMTNRSQNKLKNVEKKSKENLLRDENLRKVKLNQRKDFTSAPESEIVTKTSCSSLSTEQDIKQLDQQNKEGTKKCNGSGRVDALELKELKVLVKRFAPIPYSKDCQKNEQRTENINKRTQKLNKQNEVVDQTRPCSVEIKNNPLTDTQSPFTMCVKDNLHERLLIPLNSLNVSAKRSNDGFKNFKITVAHSSQRIVSAITQDPVENQTTTEIEEHLNKKKAALLTEESKVGRWSGIETHIMEPLGAQHSEVEPVKQIDPMPSGKQVDPMPSGKQVDHMPSGKQIDPIPNGKQVDPMSSGKQVDLMPSGKQVDHMPSGKQVDLMPSGNQVDAMPSGKQVDPLSSGKQVDLMSSGNQIDPMPSGKQVDHMPSGKQVDPLPSGYEVDAMPNGKQVDAIPSGKQVDPMPSGKQVDPMPSGKQVDPMPSGKQVDPMPNGKQVDAIPSGKQVAPMPSGNQVDPMSSGNEVDPMSSGNEVDPMSSGYQVDPMPSGYEVDPMSSGNEVDPMSSGYQVDPMGSGNQCLNTDLDTNELACPGKEGKSSFSCTTKMLSGFEKETYGDNSIDETVGNAEENNYIEKETFKILKLNWNPYFSDKKLVPLDISEEEEQEDIEKINNFPKIIRYVNDSQAPVISNTLSSVNTLDDILPQMLQMLTQHENGLDLNGVFNDIVVENSNDCYEIDYGVTDSTSDFLALGHCFGEWTNTDIVCDLCGKIFHCNEKYVEHKFLCKDDSVLDQDKDASQKFVCNICGLKYKYKKNLSRHCKSHYSSRDNALKIKIRKLLFSDKKKILSSSETSGNDVEKVVRYVAEPVSDYPPSVDDVSCDGDSTLLNLSMQSSENVSSSLMHSINDDNSTLVSSPNHYIPGKGHSDIDITDCSTEADTTIVDSCLDESFDSQRNVHNNQSVSHSVSYGESHETNSVSEFDIAKTPEKVLKTVQQRDVSTPIIQHVAKTPVQTLLEEAKENSPSRILNSFNQDSAIINQIFTLEEINRKFKNILLECKVELEYLQLQEEYMYIGDITLMKVGTCRWKVLSENQNLTLDSQANGIDDNDSDTEFVIREIQSDVNNRSNSQDIRPATNDFDVNCPTYEIEYFQSSSQLEDNSSLDNAFQTIYSSSDAHKLNKVKENRTNLLQSSPKKKLTEFEKAIITKPMEVRRKRKLERTVSTLSDSNSHDGLDFLKRANECDANHSKNENYFMSSKLAQSIIHKKAKQNEQENLNFAPCGIEDIEPFETVLASRDKVKKSPLKKKKKSKLNDSVKSTRTVLSNTLDSFLSNNSYQNTSADGNSGEINEMFQDDVTVETPRKSVLSNDSVLRKASETFDMTSSLGRYDNVALKTKKKKSLSERFGAIEKPSNSGDDSFNLAKSFKNLRSEEVMKSMFGTGAAKFDKKFRKQPGEESKQDTLMSLKSPLESVERIVTVKYGSRHIPDLKHTVVATKKKQPANTKRHLLNMLKELMDSPEGKSTSPNVSLSSPKNTGMFSDTQSGRTIIDTQKEKSYESLNLTKNSINSPSNKKQHFNITKFGVIGEPTSESERIESITAKSVQMSTLTGKSDFSVGVEQNNEKTTQLSTAKTCEKADLPHDNSSNISCTDSLCERSNSSQHSTDISTSWRKRSGSEAEGQPRKKKRIERMPIDDDKSTNESSLLFKVETQSKTVTSLSNVETQLKPVANTTQTLPSSYITKTTNVHRDGGKTTDKKSMHSDITESIIEHESRVERKEESQNITEFAVDMETKEEMVENFRTVDDAFEFDVDDHGQENENLISELEPETKVKQNNVFDESSRNINGRKDSSNAAENVNPKLDVNLTPVSSESSADFEQLENDNENAEDNSYKGNSDTDVGSESSGNEKCAESDNENSDKSDNEEENENIVSGKDDDSDESKSGEDGASSRENSDEEGNDTDDESKDENDSADESKDENDSADENNRDEIKEEEDIFSSKNCLPTKDFYHDDDAISILVDDEFETASFLIAPEGDENERMKSLDEELGELNTEIKMNCDMDICSTSSNTTSNTQLQQKFDDSNGVPSSTQQPSVVVLKDYIKTTDNYKAFHHKIQSCYHTKNWAFLGETFVELCMQGELDNSYYIDHYAKVFLTNLKNPLVLVEAFNMFMINVSRQYLEEAQEDVLAQFDARSVSYIGNRLLYACQDKKWWLEGHNIVKIMIRCNVPFYRYSEIGKQMSCITAINICLHANDVPTAYNIHLNFGWETQMKMPLPELKFEVVILHDLLDQLLNTKPREAIKVLGSCLDILDNNPELNEHFDFIEDFNKLILATLDCGDFYVGCWAFKLHATAQVSQDIDRRILRALLTACGENGYLIEAKELYKICKAKSSYPLQNIQSPRTIHLSTIMTCIEIKLEVEAYLEWAYQFLCEFQMEGNLLDNSHFFTRVYIESITDPVAYKIPYLCRVPRTENAAYNMVAKLFLDEFGIEGKIVREKNALFIYLKMEHIRNYLEILDSKGLRQGFRVRGFKRK